MEASAFEMWWAGEIAHPTDPKALARHAWDSALCAATSASLRPLGSDDPPKNGYEIMLGISGLHSWVTGRNTEGGRP